METLTINWLAVLVAGIVSFFIGFLWHGPVFGKQWIKLMEIPKAHIDAMRKKGMGAMVPQMVAAFIQQCVLATVIAFLGVALNIADMQSAIIIAIVLWVGFIATTLLNSVLWEQKKLSLYFFNIAYQLVNFIVISLIVDLWR